MNHAIPNKPSSKLGEQQHSAASQCDSSLRHDWRQRLDETNRLTQLFRNQSHYAPLDEPCCTIQLRRGTKGSGRQEWLPPQTNSQSWAGTGRLSPTACRSNTDKRRQQHRVLLRDRAHLPRQTLTRQRIRRLTPDRFRHHEASW